MRQRPTHAGETALRQTEERSGGSGPLEAPAGFGGELETLDRSAAVPAMGEADSARFFERSRDLLCIAGLDGRFKRLNPAWTTCLGWSLEALKAEPFIAFVHPEDRVATLAELGRLAEGAPTILFENRYRHRDGAYRWLEWNAWPVPGSGEINAIARDVTGRKRLEREVLEILDREKERLGRELHDGLCQSLAGIAALSATLSRRLAAKSEPAGSAAADEIAKLLSETIGQARDLARGLGPIGLNEAGLDGALEILALNVGHLHGVACTFACDGPVLELRREAAAHLFRIAQEAVNNALTHGKGDRIEIGLGSKAGNGLLSVRCNGVGLPDEAAHPGGIGLHTMAYRARLVGGSLEVRPRRPRGTAVTCVFPLAEPPETPDHARDDT